MINCGGNIGYNGLVNILEEDTKGNVQHGYLTPNSNNDADSLIHDLKENSHKIEYPCIANKPIGGDKPVHQILISAAAFGQYVGEERIDKTKEHDMQYLCALNGFRAQFAQAMELSNRGKTPVTLKAVAVGLGAFENDPEVVAKAFHQAGKEYSKALKESKVKVELQVYESLDPAELNLDSNAHKMKNFLF